jgi:hypothetical protein
MLLWCKDLLQLLPEETQLVDVKIALMERFLDTAGRVDERFLDLDDLAAPS